MCIDSLRSNSANKFWTPASNHGTPSLKSWAANNSLTNLDTVPIANFWVDTHLVYPWCNSISTLIELDPGEEKRNLGGKRKKEKKGGRREKRRRRERKKEERGEIMIEIAKRSTLRIYGSHFITIYSFLSYLYHFFFFNNPPNIYIFPLGTTYISALYALWYIYALVCFISFRLPYIILVYYCVYPCGVNVWRYLCAFWCANCIASSVL